MDFDIELKEICENHGMFLVEGNDPYHEYMNEFYKIWDEIPDDEPVAFYGYGKGFTYMVEEIDLGLKNIVCIIENNVPAYCHADKIPIIAIENISKYNFNKIILTSLNARQQMQQNIHNYNTDIEIIDVYEVLIKKGYYFFTNREPFYECLSNDWSELVDWYFIEQKRLAYKNSQTPDEAQKNLRLLIEGYLSCRDFVYADLYIQEYIERQYDDSDSLGELKDELRCFLARIKGAIKARSNKNIFVFLFDAVSYEMSKTAPFINKLRQNSLSFCNAYSSGFHTRSATLGILTGKYCVDGGIYKGQLSNRKDSEFLMKMKELGVKVKHISGRFFRFLENINDYKGAMSAMQPLIYWNLLKEVVNESADCIYFVHSTETHYPYISGNSTEIFYSKPEYVRIQEADEAPAGFFEYISHLKKEALEYSDCQLEFCFRLLDTAKDAVIVTADHNDRASLKDGKGYFDTNGVPCVKIPLVIHSKSVKPGIYKELYSAIDMPNLLSQLMFGEGELKIAPLEYIRQEVQPAYNRSLIMYKKSPNIYGRVEIFNDTEKYCLRYDGSETYCLLPDEKTNLIEDESYKERINYFRKQIQIDTRELWKIMFDRYPLMMEVHKDRVEEFLNEDKNPRHKIKI